MGQKILLVDDDPTLLRFLGDYLIHHGYQIFKATQGVEALRLAFNEHPASSYWM